MALKTGDRVQETTATTGTGTVSLAGAASGYQAFSAVLSNGDTCYYSLVSGSAWEVGLGTYATAGNTLARTTILESSNSGSAITLVGTSNVFITLPSEQALFAANNLSELFSPSAARTNLGLGTLATQNGTFSGTSSGTNTGNQTIGLTGDVVGSGTGSFAATIAANAVTNAKSAQMAAHTYKGNNTGSTANPADVTNTQLTADLIAMVGDSGSGGTKGLVPAPGVGTAAAGDFLKADGTWAVPPGSGAGPTTVVYASQSGCVSDAKLPAGSSISGVTNNTAALQAMLDKALTIPNLDIVIDGQYATNTVYHRSNSRIRFLNGGGLISLVTTSTNPYAGPLIANDTPSSASVTGSISTTAGGTLTVSAMSGGVGTFTGSLAGTALTVSSGVTGNAIAIGNFIYGAGIPFGAMIKSGSGTSWVISTGVGGVISSETMTVGTQILAVGSPIYGTNVAVGTYITALGTGLGGAGTYLVNNSQTVSSTTITTQTNVNLTVQNAILNGNRTAGAAGGTGTFTGSLSGTTLTVGTVTGCPVKVGQYLYGTSVTSGITILSGSGTTWTVSSSSSGTVGSEAMSTSWDSPSFSQANPHHNPYGAFIGVLEYHNVTGLILDDITILDPSCYQIWVANITNLQVRNISVNAINNTVGSTDGVHLNGPVTNFIIDNVYGVTGDDMVPLNADDGNHGIQAIWYPYGATAGNITNGTIKNLFPNGCISAMRLLSSVSLIDDILIDGIYGTLTTHVIIANSDPSDGVNAPLGNGNLGNITIQNVEVQVTTNSVGFQIGNTWSGNLTCKNITNIAPGTSSFFQLGQTGTDGLGRSQGVTMNSFILDGYNALDLTNVTTSHIQVLGNSTLQEIRLRNCNVRRSPTYRITDSPILTLNSTTGFGVQVVSLQDCLGQLCTHLVDHLTGWLGTVNFDNVRHVQGFCANPNGSLTANGSLLLTTITLPVFNCSNYNGPLAYELASGATITSARGDSISVADTYLQIPKGSYNIFNWTNVPVNTDVASYPADYGPNLGPIAGSTTNSWKVLSGQLLQSLGANSYEVVDSGQTNFVMRFNYTPESGVNQDIFLRFVNGTGGIIANNVVIVMNNTSLTMYNETNAGGTVACSSTYTGLGLTNGGTYACVLTLNGSAINTAISLSIASAVGSPFTNNVAALSASLASGTQWGIGSNNTNAIIGPITVSQT